MYSGLRPNFLFRVFRGIQRVASRERCVLVVQPYQFLEQKRALEPTDFIRPVNLFCHSDVSGCVTASSDDAASALESLANLFSHLDFSSFRGCEKSGGWLTRSNSPLKNALDKRVAIMAVGI